MDSAQYNEVSSSLQTFIKEIMQKNLRKSVRLAEKKHEDNQAKERPIMGSAPKKADPFSPTESALSAFSELKACISSEVERALKSIEDESFSAAILGFSGYKPRTDED